MNVNAVICTRACGGQRCTQPFGGCMNQIAATNGRSTLPLPTMISRQPARAQGEQPESGTLSFAAELEALLQNRPSLATQQSCRRAVVGCGYLFRVAERDKKL